MLKDQLCRLPMNVNKYGERAIGINRRAEHDMKITVKKVKFIRVCRNGSKIEWDKAIIKQENKKNG